MSRAADAKALAAQVEESLKSAAQGQAAAAVKRALFGKLAAQWNDAEAAGDKEALEALQALRPQLKVLPAKQPLASKLLMYVRMVLAIVVAGWGSMCVLALAPLRLTHPLLRALGVPNGLLPTDLVGTLWGRAVLAAAGVRVTLEGKGPSEQWGAGGCGVVVYNHASNLDPFIVSQICRSLAPKYLGKKMLFKFPFFGWMSLALGMVPINRGDREKAVKTMNETVGSIMRRWGRSVAVSPEGTRTTDGHLILPFKKGPFHLQEQTSAPLLPVVIHGAYELWPPRQLFTATGEVTVTVLPVQAVDRSENAREASRLALQRSLAQAKAARPELGARPLSAFGALECLAVLLCSGGVFWLFWRLYAALISALGLGVTGVIGLFSAITVVVAVFVDQFL